MTFQKTDRPALLLIDIQQGFDAVDYWGEQRNNPDAEAKAGDLLQLWRDNGLPVFHIRHCSTNPASPLHRANPGNAFKPPVQPLAHEPIIEKSVNSAFIGTDLKQQLDDERITKVVIVGLTTDHCVSTTTRMAGNYGFDTYLVSDATATFPKRGADGQVYAAGLIHETALASLNGEFATIVSTDLVRASLS